MRPMRLLTLLCFAVLLSACGGGINTGGLPDRVWPPQTSLQELRLLPDGSWQLTVRLTNFSTVSVRYGTMDLQLQVEGQMAGTIAISTDLGMGPVTAEPFAYTLQPDPMAGQTLRAAIAEGRSVRYQITGEVTALEPSGRWPQEFQGVLSPVPGVNDVLR